MAKRRATRSKRTQEKQLSPMNQYHEQGRLQAAHDPAELELQRVRCADLLAGDSGYLAPSWEELFGHR